MVFHRKCAAFTLSTTEQWKIASRYERVMKWSTWLCIEKETRYDTQKMNVNELLLAMKCGNKKLVDDKTMCDSCGLLFGILSYFRIICAIHIWGRWIAWDSIDSSEKWPYSFFVFRSIRRNRNENIVHEEMCVRLLNSGHIYRIFPRNQKCLIYNMHACEIYIYVIWSEIFQFIHVRLKNWCWGGELYNVQHEHR